MRKTMKKSFSLVLMVIMLINIVCISVNAEIYGGNCGEQGDNINWELDTDTKTLKISGTGYMINFATNQYGLRAPWYSYRNYIESVVVEDGIKGIEGYSFYNCNKLKTIYISKDVTFFGVYSFSGCTSLEKISFPNGLSIIGDYAFKNCSNIKDVYYDGSIREWKNVQIYRSNDIIKNANIYYSDIYNIGEETYNFKNFSDKKSDGYCFGMSSTSSGYHIGVLDIGVIGGNYTDDLYCLAESEALKDPIKFYQRRQGLTSNRSIVAGGTHYKSFGFYSDIEKDWNEVVDYVKNHKYDDTGTLQIGYRFKHNSKLKGHSVNFLRYSKVDNQERIYIYDNNCPHCEKYLYKAENGQICYKNLISKECTSECAAFNDPLICIAIRDMEKFFSISKEFKSENVIYAKEGTICIDNSLPYLMDGNENGTSENMYEFEENTTMVTIKPLIDNASFTYMGEEYSFGKIDEDTYAELTLSTSEEDEPEFEIVNNPHEHSYDNVIRTEANCINNGSITFSCSCGDAYTEVIPSTGHTFSDGNSKCSNCDYDRADSCGCKCHKSGIAKIIFKIILIFQKIFKKNRICEGCGVYHY